VATTSTSTTAVPAATAAVQRWLGHLAAHDDDGAFADLAPRSRAAVGDVENYRRGSGRFSPTYARFAAPDTRVGPPLSVAPDLVAITKQRPGDDGPMAAAVPVRLVNGAWFVDPILDVGSYASTPDDGSDVSARPTLTVELFDPATTARVWFDDTAAEAASPTTFRPRTSLSPGWHVATLVVTRGDDVVAHTVRLRVT
jgi:hypothetical protein